jgi:hypothetical protein
MENENGVLSIDTNGYQLKSQKSRLDESITDGAYAAMMNAIRHDETPNFYFMHPPPLHFRLRAASPRQDGAAR